MAETCTYLGCDRPGPLAQGLCNMHYQRWRRRRGHHRVINGLADEIVPDEVVDQWRQLYVAYGERNLAQLLAARMIDSLYDWPLSHVTEIDAEPPDL